jgi:hypothetical protein
LVHAPLSFLNLRWGKRFTSPCVYLGWGGGMSHPHRA